MALRPFIPVIISIGGGGKTLPLFQEKPLNIDVDVHYQRFKSSSIDYDVNTTLELSSTRVHSNSDNPIPEGGVNLSLGLGGAAKKRKHDDDDDETETIDGFSDPHVYNPMPLQWYMPEGGEIMNLGLVEKKNKNKRKKKPRINDVVNVDQVIVPSIGEFPDVMQAIESLDGSRPDFLYSKKLVPSDVRAGLNRLFLTNGEALLEFLSAAETAALAQGLTVTNIVGVDQRGNKYHLKMKNWSSLNVTVIKSDWNKMVAVNNAEKDDLVHIWGFRRPNGELGFAVVFRKL